MKLMKKNMLGGENKGKQLKGEKVYLKERMKFQKKE